MEFTLSYQIANSLLRKAALAKVILEIIVLLHIWLVVSLDNLKHYNGHISTKMYHLNGLVVILSQMVFSLPLVLVELAGCRFIVELTGT